MSQRDILNNCPIDSQINIGTNNGSIYIGESSRISSYFEKLCKEIENNTTIDIIEGLLAYKTILDGTKGLDEKLKDGGFSQSAIDDARRQKELYAKKATQYECYPSAQQINLLLFARIKNEFNVYILPLIKDRVCVDIIMRKIYEQIVNPIMDLLDAHGSYDEYLHYTSDHIYGMIYYLTGMCHLNWKDYDNL